MSENIENPLSYENILENLGEGVVVVDPGLKVVFFNQSAEKITALSRSMVLGKSIEEVFSRDKRLAEMLTKTLAEGRLFAEYEEKLSRRFSGPLPVAITTSQIFDAGGELTGAVAVIKDLSGVKSLEAGSLRRERLAHIGTFAASLAHEIRNPLSGIRGAAQLLSRKTRDDKLAEYTGVIMREADRLNNILDGMLDFVRPSRLTKKSFNIHKVLDSVILLVGEGAREEAHPPEIVKEYDPSIPEVFGDDGQLTQVFLNLVKNAREALGEDGKITVVTRIATDFHLVAAEEGEAPGSKARRGAKRMMASVEIRDNGCGIKTENMEKIFTPFFTTKRGGSGLGMAITLKIVKEHEGLLRIDSTPGEGTSVVVYLPVTEG